MATKLIDKYLNSFISPNEYETIAPQVTIAHDLLHSGTGLGNDFLGWADLPVTYDKDEFLRIKQIAKSIRENCDIFIVIGIGGSYLGARAVIEFLLSQNYNHFAKDRPEIYFVGNNMSTTYISEIMSLCEGKDVILNVISKSGNTLEPAIAFHAFRKYMENKYGEDETRKRIICTTDSSHGILKNLSVQKGYETLTIPNNIGGRFSVLTSVGLLPISVAGCDIDALMLGAYEAYTELSTPEISNNDCYKYAAIRNILYQKGKQIEIFVSYEPYFSSMSEWIKQLFGESEGKNHKGIFPASAIFSTDLHSMGQFIQDGSRTMFETVAFIENNQLDLTIGYEPNNIDGLNFLSEKKLAHINKITCEATVLAHSDGGVPNILLTIPDRTEKELGYLIYFLEKACAISGYMLGVNPFDQPGVEKYKKNMICLLTGELIH